MNFSNLLLIDFQLVRFMKRSKICENSLSMRNMGSPRKDNPLTNAEIKCRWQEKNRDKDGTKKREAYAQKQQFLPKK